MQSIGFIGLGHMGQPMAMNLVKAGFDVHVFDVVEDAATPLLNAGAKLATSVAEMAQAVDVIITSVQTGQQVEAICLGDQGVFNHARSGSYFIDCSSIDVDTARRLHKQAQDANIHMIDAPVSGGVKGAEAGSLTIMCGGASETFAAVRPILDVLGKNLVHAGPAGNGQVAKICNNMLLAISMIGVGEAFTLGERLGLDPKTLFEISSKSSGQCWSMTQYCPVPGCVEGVPSNNDYKPGFSSAMMLKDLHLSQDAAQSAQLDTQLGSLATRLYQQFNDSGHDNVDFSGIIKQIAGD